MKNQLRIAWKDSVSLTATAVLMLAAFIPAALGIFLDGRMITGVPLWLKPAKFAISSAIYAATLAWLFRYITAWPRFVRAMGNIVAAVLVLEVAIIFVQAARGTTSHFNNRTLLDGILFAVMGVSIIILWLASVGILVALFRSNIPNAAWKWSLRLGLLISLVGSGAGGLMLPHGAHTVGAPDGGPGLPGVGWSTQHGDLRVPHFFGMHALQIVPFLGWFLTRRRRAGQVEIVFAVAAIYFASLVIFTWQALSGHPLLTVEWATFSSTAAKSNPAFASAFAVFAPLRESYFLRRLAQAGSEPRESLRRELSRKDREERQAGTQRRNPAPSLRPPLRPLPPLPETVLSPGQMFSFLPKS